jgi:tetratricopeptide (TPR) repeat protein
MNCNCRSLRVVALVQDWVANPASKARLLLGAVAISLTLTGCANGGRALNWTLPNLDWGQQYRAAQDPAAMMRIAEAAKQAGDAAAAAAFYQRAADLAPDSVEARIGLAESLSRQGRVDEAINDLRLAVTQMPSNPQLCVTLARTLVATGRSEQALDTLRGGLQQSRSAPLLIAEGIALDQIGRHREAQASYRGALKISPDSAAAKQDLALSLAASKTGGGPGAALISSAAR